MQHLIHNLHVTLRVPEMHNAFSMQERVKACLQQEWVTEIAQVLDKYGQPDVFLQIERLDIKLEGLPEQHWERHFQERFIEALDKALAGYGTTVSPQTITPSPDEGLDDQPWGLRSASTQYQEAWMFFMQYGLLPWWMQQESTASLEQKVIQAMLQQPQRCAALWAAAWAEGKISVQRWVQQCSPALQRAVLEAICGEQSTTLLTGREAMLLLKFSVGAKDVHLRKLQMVYWDAVFTLLMRSQFSIRELKKGMKEKWERWMGRPVNLTETDILDKTDLGETDTPEEENTIMPPEVKEDKKLHFSPDLGLGEHLLVKQAGVILLHPFLQYLFKDLQWVDENGTSILPEHQSRAVHLLQFMASGEEEIPEYEMALLKLLCGMALDAPVERYVELTTEEKEKSLELLQAVINHWSALGTTSPDGLRGTFLLREGKLVFTENHWQLLIAPRTLDILLNQLPWGIGIIKLPWMEQLLKVQWIA